jgi:glycosyltransferase involved in cell wall biosynthesis
MGNETFQLSIITINLNNSQGLRRTICSVVNQSFREFEYIIIDGGSSDNSISVIKEHLSGINYWLSEPDKGIYHAMNKGVKLAKGEYCLFLNSGDYLLNDKVIENLLKEKLNSEIVACGIKSVRNGGCTYNYPPKEISLFTFTNGSLFHPATLIKKDLFNRFGYYDENYKILSDWKFFTKVLILHNCTYKFKSEILTVFEAEYGVSSSNYKLELPDADNLLKEYFPRIVSDYYLDNRVEYEYFQNIFNVLIKNKLAFLLIKPFLRVINRLICGRLKNDRLISIKRSNQRPSY